MKRISSLLLTFLLVFVFIAPNQVSAVEKTIPGIYYGKVTRVIDGNSFVLDSLDGQSLTIKIAGINTSSNPDALALTTAFLQGQNLKVDLSSDTSTYLQPYYYGVVYVNDIDIAKMYLQSGFCKVDPTTVPAGNLRIYQAYQNDAKYWREGIWK